MIPPIVDGLFEVDGDAVTLIGGRSRSSGRCHFPLSDTCPYGGTQDIDEVRLSRTGTVWAATTVRAAPPGYDGPVPYGLGVVELPEGVRVVSRLRGDVTVGASVTCIAETVSTPEGQRAVWAFARDGEA